MIGQELMFDAVKWGQEFATIIAPFGEPMVMLLAMSVAGFLVWRLRTKIWEYL
jgi:hypothetical protein